MFTLIRLAVIASVSAILLTACGDNNNQNDQKQNAPASSSAAPASNSSAAGDMGNTVAAGTSEKDAIAKLGKPDLSQTHKLDALTITHDEWHTDKGTIAAQFQDGVAKYSQFIPKNAQ